MLVLLVRHGESAFNAAGKLAGQADVPLSPRGRQQVEALAPVVARFRPDRVFSSDLARTRETAAILGYGDAECRPALREMDLGAWTSADVETLQQEQPENYAAWRAGTLTPPGGEAWTAFSRRVEGALEDAMNGGDGSVLLSTHGGVIRAACDLLIGLPPSQAVPVNPASLTVFDCGERARLLAYNASAAMEAVAGHI